MLPPVQESLLLKTLPIIRAVAELPRVPSTGQAPDRQIVSFQALGIFLVLLFKAPLNSFQNLRGKKSDSLDKNNVVLGSVNFAAHLAALVFLGAGKSSNCGHPQLRLQY